MYIGTIHGYCAMLLKEIEPAYRSFDVLDEAMRIAWLNKYENYMVKVGLKKLQDSLSSQSYVSRFKVMDMFVASADIVMTENVNLAKINRNEQDRAFRECYKGYRKALQDDKYFDFTSIIRELVDLLKKEKKFLKKVNGIIKHVTVDEYQDVNSIQEELVEILSSGAKSVCVVGDDDQNIYNWRGSNVGIIRDFAKKYSSKYSVTEVNLDINYRSTEEVISTCRGFIENNTNRLAKAMVHNKELSREYEDGDILHRHFQTEEEEFRFIVTKIRELIGSDFVSKHGKKFSLSYGNIAILVRSNSDGSRITNYLSQNNVEAISYGGQSVFKNPEVELAMDCISFVFSCKSYTQNNLTVEEFKKRYKIVFPSARYAESDADEFVKKLQTIKSNADSKLAKKPRDYIGGLGLQEYYHNILNAFGAERFDFGRVYNYNFAVLSDAVSDYEMVYQRLRASQVEGFVYFVLSFVKSKYTETIHNDPTIQDAVNVLTIHKAKGLEFPVVFIPCFHSRSGFPRSPTFVDKSLYNSTMYDGDEEDERRTYYTAMTRSEKYLYMTGSERRDSTGIRIRKPHRFMNEIPGRYFSKRLHPERKKSGLVPMPLSDVEYSTSFSELNSYDRCPKDFEMRHMFGFNAGVPPGFGFGTNLHNMLNMIFNNYIEKRMIPSETEIKKMFDRTFKLRYAPGEMSENLRKKAEKIIKRYVELNKQDFSRVLTTEKNFEFAVGKTLISGQIDLLMKVDESGKATGVEIIDYKSEEKTEGEYQMDHEKQLRYYALACKDSLDMNPSSAWVHHLSETDPAKRKSMVDISDRLLESTKKSIDQQVENVLSKNFDANPRNKKDTCKECDYSLICSEKEFERGMTLPDVKALSNGQGAQPASASAERGGLSKKTMEKAMKDSRNVTKIDGNTYEVVSSGSGTKYKIVDGKCTCQGFKTYYRKHSGKRTCSHIEAIRISESG